VPDNQLEFDSDMLDRIADRFHLNASRPWGRGRTDRTGAKAYCDKVLENVQDGSGDADVIPAYFIHKLKHSDGREVLALTTVTGYSFSEINSTFHRQAASC
jgi:hypothetical protein